MKHQDYAIERRKHSAQLRKAALYELLFYSAVIIIIVSLVMVTR